MTGDLAELSCEVIEVGSIVALNAVRDSVRTLLASPTYRRSAERIQTDIHEMPEARDAIRRIEALTPG